MKNFSLEEQYQLYLQRVGLHEKTLTLTQAIEIKRAFMGACGQLLILFYEESIEDQDEAIAVLQNMLDQVKDYWKEES